MLVKHESNGVTWYSFAPLDELGFLANWVTTNANNFDLARSNNNVDAINNLALANKLFADGRKIFLPTQVHGTDVCELTSDGNAPVPADAVITSKPLIPAGVLTADCLPIILADPEKKKAAIIHAGRKGIFNDVIGKTISELKSENLAAVIGPAIRKCCYEVKGDVFENGFDGFKKYFADGKLDLIRAAIDQLSHAGVTPENIYDSGICTVCGGGEFYSHRREAGKAGRFMTGIMIKGS